MSAFGSWDALPYGDMAPSDLERLLREERSRTYELRQLLTMREREIKLLRAELAKALEPAESE